MNTARSNLERRRLNRRRMARQNSDPFRECDFRKWTKYFESFLRKASGFVSSNCLHETWFDDTICELLITNLNILKESPLRSFPSSMKTYLEKSPSGSMELDLEILVVYCSYKCYSLQELEDDKISRLLDVTKVALSFLNVERRFLYINLIRSEAVPALERALEDTDDQNQSRVIVNTLRLIDVLFASAPKDCDLVISVGALEHCLLRILLLNEPKSIMYSLGIMRSISLIIDRNTSFIEKIWKKVVQKLTEDESRMETCLTVLSHSLRLEIELEEKSSVADTNEFWIVMKKCFQANTTARKRALPVFKYVLSNNVLQPEYCSWWRTYFVIADSLDEKQPHIVLPNVRLIKNLQNSEIRIDEFWLLNLIEQAATHDSRSVRLEALNILFEWNVNKFCDDDVSILVKILRTCNDSSLFRKIFATKTFDTFKNRLIKWVNDLSWTRNENTFVQLLFDDIVKQKWSPIPLYYILEILSDCSHLPLKFTCDDQMKTFMMNVTHSHNIAVRSAVQISFLRIILVCGDSDFNATLQIFELLNCCKENECLSREMWSEIVDFIRTGCDFDLAERWLLGELSQKVDCVEQSSANVLSSLARNIALLHDALGILDKANRVRERFSKLALSFKWSNEDPYPNVKVNYLKLVVRILRYRINVDIVRECTFVKIVTYAFESLEENDFDSAVVDFHISCLKDLTSCETFVVDENLGALISEWLRNFTQDLSLYVCVKLMQWVCELSARSEAKSYSEDWRNVIVSRVDVHLKAYGEQSFILDRSNNSCTTAISTYFDSFWSLFTWCAKDKSECLHERFQADVILKLVVEALQLARNENLTSLFRAFEFVFRNEFVLNDEESMLTVIDESWTRVQEIQATPYYESAVHSWITAFIQESVLRCEGYQSEIEDRINEFLRKSAENGEQSFRSVNAILKQLSKIAKIQLVFPPVIDILVNTFCTTHISRKDLRIEHETMDRIRLLHKKYLVPEVLDANYVLLYEENRLRALNLILKIVEEEDSPAVCVAMVEALTQTHDSAKKRYFGDSSFHRTKHKQLQLLLVLEFALHRRYDRHLASTVECYEKIYNFTVRNLLGEPHQPSVRYMLEWLLVRVVIHRFSEFEGKFWSSFSQASEERIGSVCSFIMVAFHLANLLKNEQFAESAVKVTLPWCMAQHFNARLYAQSVLKKLMNLNENVGEKYRVVENSLDSCLKRGNAVKNATKLQDDFYFCRFHPEEHFTFQTILWDLPRLSNISRDEWIQVDSYREFLTPDFGIRLYDDKSSNSLSSFECSSWVAKASTTTNEGPEIASDAGETQKKFIPEDVMTSRADGQRKRSELVVVASLIDRMPNLGGLTRTCEIFAVSELVLDSLDVVRNKEFTSLSITAEKHVPMTAVKRHNLFTYLKSMKEKRYCIVGVEQTTNSRSLDNFTFPTKSVIVLGNEKEGISADLLPALDVCVEIPQVGVIRSLNVHVSASLIIWEYAKQHNIFTAASS